MVGELAIIINDVRDTARQVLTSATEMIGAMEATAGGAQTQSREAVGVSDAMEGLSRSMRRGARHPEAPPAPAPPPPDPATHGGHPARPAPAPQARIPGGVRRHSQKLTYT